MIDSIPPAPMADEGVDLGYYDDCGQFRQVVYIGDTPYCQDHIPLVLNAEDFDMIFEKAGVPHQPDTLLKQLRAIFMRGRD